MTVTEYSLMPAQQRLVHVENDDVDVDVCLYQGGYGCVDGDTLISLADGTEVPIKSFKGGMVLSWDGSSIVHAYATASASYQPKQLYEVKTTDGLKIICTGSHQFLALDSWVETSHLKAGDVILTQGNKSFSTPPLSSLECGLSIHVLSEERSTQKALNSTEHCLICCRQYGEQPLLVEHSGLKQNPSQDDVLEHNHLNLHTGVLDNEQACTHFYQSFDPHSMMGCQDQNERPLGVPVLFYDEQNTFGRPLDSFQQLPISHESLTPAQLNRLFSGPFPSQSCYFPLESPLSQYLTESVIESITPVKEDFYYDLHVPGYNNYVAQGFINHNSGKSWAGSFLGLALAEKYPGSWGLCGALTYTMIKDTTLQSYFQHLDVLGFRNGKEYIFNKSEMRLTFPNWGNSTILFRHMEDPEKLKSLNLSWAHLEEMSQLPESVFLMVLSRLRQQCVKRYRCFGTSNPQANKGWIHKRFVENAGLHEEDGVKIHYRRVIAPSTDNIHLNKAYLANMALQFDPEYYRINVLGEDGDYTSGLVVKGWSHLNEREDDYIPHLPLHITCDFNVDPMCWVLMQRYNDEYHYFDEIVIENTVTVDTVKEFARRYPPDKVKSIIINGDASGDARSTQAQQQNGTNYRIMRSELSALGYTNVSLQVRSRNPDIVDRVAAFNAMVNNTQGQQRVFVNPKRCKWTLYNINNLMYQEGTSTFNLPSPSQIKKDPQLKFMGHPFDALTYPVEYYDPVVLRVKAQDGQESPVIEFEV